MSRATRYGRARPVSLDTWHCSIMTLPENWLETRDKILLASRNVKKRHQYILSASICDAIMVARKSERKNFFFPSGYAIFIQLSRITHCRPTLPVHSAFFVHHPEDGTGHAARHAMNIHTGQGDLFDTIGVPKTAVPVLGRWCVLSVQEKGVRTLFSSLVGPCASSATRLQNWP
jgi:hypothetical protein